MITCPRCAEENYPDLRCCVSCSYEFKNGRTLDDGVLPQAPTPSAWPFRDIVLGIGVVILWVFLSKFRVFQSNYQVWATLQLSLWLLLFLFMFLYPVYLFKKRSFGPLFKPVSLGAFFKEVLISFWFAFLISLSLGIVAIFIEGIFNLKPTENPIHYALGFAPYSKVVIFMAVVGFTLGPVAEEFFYRGFLYNALKSRLNIYVATILQALVFSFVHQETLLNSILIFLIGIALVMVYEKRKTLLTPVLIHGIFNFLVLFPALLLAIENHHVPAATWEEAYIVPEWFTQNPSGEVEQQENGTKQREHATDTWGIEGSRKWKKEAIALNAVCFFFPEDTTSCAKARVGIIYTYLQHFNDPRRTIVESDELIAQFPEERESVAKAFLYKGWAYYMLEDYGKSKRAFSDAINSYGDLTEILESAQKGINLINELEDEQP